MIQTDYDKALMECKAALGNPYRELTIPQMVMVEQAFRKGYEYGVWSQMEKQKAEQCDHERNLVALGDEYMTARIDARDNGFNGWCDSDVNHDTLSAYFQGWEDADAFDEDWTAQHPKDMLDRILDEYPDMIENEVKARMKDIENENRKTSQNIANCDIDHFRDDKKKLRAEIAKDIFTRCLAHEDGDVRAFCNRNIQMHARECVEAADALLAELEKASNFSNRDK